jgi:hypothetical protein
MFPFQLCQNRKVAALQKANMAFEYGHTGKIKNFLNSMLFLLLFYLDLLFILIGLAGGGFEPPTLRL